MNIVFILLSSGKSRIREKIFTHKITNRLKCTKVNKYIKGPVPGFLATHSSIELNKTLYVFQGC